MSRQLFMIGSEPRSGTHMLESALGTHSDICCYGEIFNPHVTRWKNWRCQTVKDMVAGMLHNGQRPRVGFCLHTDQYAVPKNNVMSDMGRAPDWNSIPQETKVIRLRRKDQLAGLISHSTANRTNRWQWNDPRRKGFGPKLYVKPEIKPFSITKDELLCLYKERSESDAIYKHWELRFFNVLPVWYEDLVDNWEETMNRICHFLDVSPCELEPLTKKTGVPVRELILNFNEVKEKCFGTPLYRMFDETP